MLNIVGLSVAILNAVMSNVIRPNVVRLIVVAPPQPTLELTAKFIFSNPGSSATVSFTLVINTVA